MKSARAHNTNASGNPAPQAGPSELGQSLRLRGQVRLTLREAKERLSLFRPGTRDGEDREIAEALDLAAELPELAAWLAKHCALCEILRAKFRQIPVPKRRSRSWQRVI